MLFIFVLSQIRKPSESQWSWILPANVISNTQAGLCVGPVQTLVLEHESLRDWLHLKRMIWRTWRHSLSSRWRCRTCCICPRLRHWSTRGLTKSCWTQRAEPRAWRCHPLGSGKKGRNGMRHWKEKVNYKHRTQNTFEGTDKHGAMILIFSSSICFWRITFNQLKLIQDSTNYED